VIERDHGLYVVGDEGVNQLVVIADAPNIQRLRRAVRKNAAPRDGETIVLHLQCKKHCHHHTCTALSVVIVIGVLMIMIFVIIIVVIIIKVVIIVIFIIILIMFVIIPIVVII
jgi:hypothetical protein